MDANQVFVIYHYNNLPDGDLLTIQFDSPCNVSVFLPQTAAYFMRKIYIIIYNHIACNLETAFGNGLNCFKSIIKIIHVVISNDGLTSRPKRRNCYTVIRVTYMSLG